MKYYEWSRELKIILYGVNEYAVRLAGILRRDGFAIIAFIDRRADELKNVQDIPVYEMDDPYLRMKDQDRCVLIMLQNAMQHDEIAEKLSERGIEKIIYIPMRFGAHAKYAYELIEVYNAILIGNYQAIGKIPYYQYLKHIRQEQEEKQSGDYLTADVEADLIFTSQVEPAPYADVPLVRFAPYTTLFEYLGANENLASVPKEYLERYGVKSCNYTNTYTDQDILRQRAELYELWNEHFQAGREFFRASAPLAQWNERGYFNLCEGQHRTLFLVTKGLRYVPVRLKREDYEKWKGSYKEQVKISLIDSMLWMQKNLPDECYRDRTVLSMDDMQGFYGRHMYRLGGGKVIIVDADAAGSAADAGWEYDERLHSEELREAGMVLLIGSSVRIAEAKEMLWQLWRQGLPTEALVGMTEQEYAMLDAEIRKRAVWISKVFWETEMLNIYWFGTEGE